MFLVGLVQSCAAASYLQGEAVFGCESSAGRGQESGARRPGLPQLEVPVLAQLPRSLPSFFPLAGRDHTS